MNIIVLGKIDAIRLLNRVSFHVPRIVFHNKQIFEFSTRKTNYLYNDAIQRTMRLINLETNLLDF